MPPKVNVGNIDDAGDADGLNADMSGDRRDEEAVALAVSAARRVNWVSDDSQVMARGW